MSRTHTHVYIYSSQYNEMEPLERSRPDLDINASLGFRALAVSYNNQLGNSSNAVGLYCALFDTPTLSMLAIGYSDHGA